MSIKNCPDCNGSGRLPRGYKGRKRYSKTHALKGQAPDVQQKSCWCACGKVSEEQPAFWRNVESVKQVFHCSYEDLEKAVSDFLEHIEPQPEQIKLLKFYLAQWVMNDPQPPLEWLGKCHKTAPDGTHLQIKNQDIISKRNIVSGYGTRHQLGS